MPYLIIQSSMQNYSNFHKKSKSKHVFIMPSLRFDIEAEDIGKNN